MTPLPCAVRITLLAAALLACAGAMAQQRPLTGQMLGDAPPTAAPAAPMPSPAAPPLPASRQVLPPLPASAPLATLLPSRPQIGDTTRALLQLQASGASAGTLDCGTRSSSFKSPFRFSNTVASIPPPCVEPERPATLPA